MIKPGAKASAKQVIEDIYRTIVMRPVDPGGMAHWLPILSADITRVNDLIVFLLGTDEFATVSKKFFHHYIAPAKIQFLHDNSQNGEISMLLDRIVNGAVSHHVVVDVGAYGRQGSNSYDLMRHFGWRGVLVEPNPYLAPKIAQEFAGLDYCLVSAAATTYNGRASLHLGVDAEISSIHRASTEHWGPIRESCDVEAKRLPDILAECNVPKEFGLLSLDTEGEPGSALLEDVFVAGYRPKWVILEVFEGLKVKSLDEIQLSDPVKSEYRIIGKTFPNLILESASATANASIQPEYQGNARAEVNRLQAENARLLSERNALLSSSSWRITAPLRAIRELFKS